MTPGRIKPGKRSKSKQRGDKNSSITVLEYSDENKVESIEESSIPESAVE